MTRTAMSRQRRLHLAVNCKCSEYGTPVAGALVAGTLVVGTLVAGTLVVGTLVAGTLVHLQW
jgi:hypothetical protein